MNDAGSVSNESEKPEAAAVIDVLDRLNDAELQEVVKRGQAILANREQERRRAEEREKQERRREAMREIQRLAKEAGLKVDIGERPRRGRPPKKEPSP
jgi:hypothetical protein